MRGAPCAVRRARCAMRTAQSAKRKAQRREHGVRRAEWTLAPRFGRLLIVRWLALMAGKLGLDDLRTREPTLGVIGAFESRLAIPNRPVGLPSGLGGV